jgi:phosphatidylglycerophosphate synthase
VGVPAEFRGTAVGRAIEANPRARRAVRWLERGEGGLVGSLLLVPASMVLPVDALRILLQSPPAAVLAGSPDAAPVAIADATTAGPVVQDIGAGKPVGAALSARLRQLDVSRVPGGWCVWALTEGDRRHAERRLEAGLGSVIDSWLDTAVHRRASRLFTRWAVEIGLSPNMVSLLSLAVGLVAVGCWAHATLSSALLGLALYFLSVVLDHSDGEVARLTFAESKLGEWLDASVDTVIHVLGALALGLAAARGGGRGLFVGVLAALGFAASALVAKTSPRPIAGQGLPRAISAVGTRDGYYLLLVLFILALGVAPASLPLLVIVAAIGSHAYWITALVVRARHHAHPTPAGSKGPRRGWSAERR